jgi:membrane-bound inhibitor of C-type lysozyme
MKKYLVWALGFIFIIIAWWFLAEKSAQPDMTLIARASYLCQDNKIIDADFYQGAAVAVKPGEMPVPNGSVSLKLSDGRALTLPQTVSASGIRYANADESIIFWNKGDGAFITENNIETFSGCVTKTTETVGSPGE